MSDIIKRTNKTILLVLLILVSCKTETTTSQGSSDTNSISIETKENGKVIFNEFQFYITDLGAVYVDIPNFNEDLLESELIDAAITLDNKDYDIKIIKQFFDRTTTNKSFFFTVKNQTKYLIRDKIKDKDLFLIGFEDDIKQSLQEANIVANKI